MCNLNNNIQAELKDKEEELNQNNEKIIEYEKVNLIQYIYYLYFKYKEEE